MNAFIVTEGGENIGFGHIIRCISIYQAFEEFGIIPQLIVNGDETVRDFVKDKNCAFFNWLNDREKLFYILKDADVFFVDSYLASRDLYEKISNFSGTGVYLDDTIKVEYPKGFVVNGAISAERMPYPKIEGITYLLGAQYAPLRKEFWDTPSKPIRDNIEVIMVTFGGADVRNLTPRVLKLLAETYPELVKKVIVGKGFQNTTEIEGIKDRNTELIYYPDAAEMKKIMFESDIAITAGGQTLYELARVGLAAIGICVAKNQLQNIDGWTKLGFLEYTGWYSDASLENGVMNSLMKLNCADIREEKAVIGRRFIDGQGCKRIVNAIITELKAMLK